MKIYTGERASTNHVNVFVNDGEKVQRLWHVVHHSPTGFEWGYGGSGPADLALSILCNFFKQKPTKRQIYHGHFKAQPHYQEFKRDFVAGWGPVWSITEAEIESWLKAKIEIKGE